jgi:hypothetical protein
LGARAASGTSGVAIGYYTQNEGSYDIGIGQYADAFSTNSTAIGNYSGVGNEAVGLGDHAMATGNYAIAIGYYSDAENANEINISNNDSVYGSSNGHGGYTQLRIINGEANFQNNSIRVNLNTGSGAGTPVTLCTDSNGAFCSCGTCG